jgi:hypothetical protein
LWLLPYFTCFSFVVSLLLLYFDSRFLVDYAVSALIACLIGSVSIVAAVSDVITWLTEP